MDDSTRLTLLEYILENSFDRVVILDEDGTYQFVAPSMERIMGYTPEELEGKSSQEFIHPDDRERVTSVFQEVLANPDDVYTMEYRVRNKDGSWQWVKSRERNLLDEPEIEGVLVNSQDITERRTREQQLQETNQRLEAILNTVDAGIFLKDTNGRYQLFNDTARQTHGITDDEEVIGRTARDLFPEETADQIEAHDRCVFEEAEPIRREETFHDDGESRTHLTIKSPIFDEDGDITGLCAVSTDITDRVQTREELQRQNERLDNFVSVVSHDLRNPLNVAKGRLDLLEAECSSEHLPPIRSAIARMAAIVGDTLELARQGQTIDTIESVALPELLDACWMTVENPDAELSIEEELIVRADPERLRSVFENLFANAVTHGGETVQVRVGRIENDGFYIADDGPGIPEDKRGMVFDPGHSTAEDGTGFGLAIVNEIVEAHGWEISIEESEEGGVRFEITGVEVID
ncbi:MAG: PAS domain S-box protein [Halobacteriales archaeon]|nr:PAS domain S-box protein [Halobacteriales archaeon]